MKLVYACVPLVNYSLLIIKCFTHEGYCCTGSE